MSPRLASLIKSKTVKEMWEIVKNDTTSKSKMHQVDTRCCLQEMICPEEGEVQEHLDTMVNLHDELARMGSPIMDEEFSTLILGSLPPCY